VQMLSRSEGLISIARGLVLDHEKGRMKSTGRSVPAKKGEPEKKWKEKKTFIESRPDPFDPVERAASYHKSAPL